MKGQEHGGPAQLRDSGIDIIGKVPWGTHFCQFYETDQDLISMLIPYLRAGLEANEFCMWVTSEPLGVEPATRALREAVPDLDCRIRSGQIEIIPHTDWYFVDGKFDQDRILRDWIRKLNAALENGFEGLRLTGNTFWLEMSAWQDFTHYEEAINSVIGNYRMLALCTYSADKCGLREIVDVISNHEFALIKRGDKWVMIESSTVRQAKQALEQANKQLAATARELEAANNELRATQEDLKNQIEEQKRIQDALRENEMRLKRSQEIAHLGTWELDLTTGNLMWSDEVYRIFGVEPQEFAATYEAFLEAVHPDDRNAVDEAYRGSVREGKDSYEIEHRVIRKSDGEIRIVHERCQHFRNEAGQVIRSTGMVHDVTDRKLVEQQLAEARAHAERHAAELESFITSMSDGVVLQDAEGNAILANDAARDILGSDPLISIRQRVEQYRISWLDGTPMTPEETASSRALRGEVVRDLRYRMTTPAGQDKVISVSSSPVRASDGRVIGAATIFRDITSEHELEQQRQEIFEREHRIAETLQQALIPPRVPMQIGNFKIGVRYQPALHEAEVGGDFYDVFEPGRGKLAVLIGDVVGKGLAAAMRVAGARHAIRSYAFIDPRPAHVMTLANVALCQDNIDVSGMLTAFFAVIDTTTGTVTYTSAGHEPPLVCRASGRIEELWFAGVPLGIDESSTYTEETIVLTPGDTMVIVTDGVTEARAPGPVLFEKKGVIEYLADHAFGPPDETASGLLAAASAHAGGRLQDDAVVVVVRLEHEPAAC